LKIAVALPLVYPPDDRHGREVLDAAFATHSPVWLATGQEDLPIVVLRAPAPGDRRPRRNVVAWTNDVMYSSVASRDTLQLERLPRVRVINIETRVAGFDTSIGPREVKLVIETGRCAVAEAEERGVEHRWSQTHTRGQHDRGQDDRGQDDRGQDDRGQDDRGQDDRGQHDRGQDDRGQDDRRGTRGRGPLPTPP
jgi:hypothetical protein